MKAKELLKLPDSWIWLANLQLKHAKSRVSDSAPARHIYAHIYRCVMVCDARLMNLPCQIREELVGGTNIGCKGREFGLPL